MKRLFGLGLAGLLFLGVCSTPAVADHDIVKVWTQNLYIGADLTPLILAGTSADFYDAAAAVLEQVAANYFPIRAQRFATEIALYQPDLIGLQEVSNFTINGINSGPPFVDYLDEILDALADRGQRYTEKARVVNTDLSITLPFDVTGDGVPDTVRVVDRDVILVREGVTAIPLTGLYNNGGLCGVPIINPVYDPMGSFSDLLVSKESEDGCNYTISALASTPIGPIFIKRGFVGVDATVRGKDVRFVDTHLEEMEPDPADSGSAVIQFLQSLELVETLKATTPSDRTPILVGDFNSSPDDLPSGHIIPPYEIISGEGFADIWNTNPLALFDPNGFTCCQDEDLANRRSYLDERIDLIFAPDRTFQPWAFVTGRVPIFPLFLPPNWPSDHGGVFARLIF
jgi:Endonuclease/Exonuclease/phosphatase family